MHGSCWQNNHIWEYALHLYANGDDGVKNVAKKLGLGWTGLALRVKQRGIPRKLHASTRKKLSGCRAITELNKKWALLLVRTRKPQKRNKNPMDRYYADHEQSKKTNRENAKKRYDARKADPAFMAKRRQRLQGYRESNRDKYRERNREWSRSNPDKIRKATKLWAINNPEKHKAARRRNENRPSRKILSRLRCRLRQFVNDGKAKSERMHKLIACTPAHLVAHLQSLFTGGMTWANMGAWHIDHIRPCASFDLTKSDDMSACWHWTNLQPLWAKDNIAKGCKLPSQLS